MRIRKEVHVRIEGEAVFALERHDDEQIRRRSRAAYSRWSARMSQHVLQHMRADHGVETPGRRTAASRRPLRRNRIPAACRSAMPGSSWKSTPVNCCGLRAARPASAPSRHAPCRSRYRKRRRATRVPPSRAMQARAVVGAFLDARHPAIDVGVLFGVTWWILARNFSRSSTKRPQYERGTASASALNHATPAESIPRGGNG